MACTQNLEQEPYKDLIVGLKDNEITLYPLGETIRLEVYASEDWELDLPKNQNGLGVVKEDYAVKLVADPNFTEDIFYSFDIVSLSNASTIDVSQESVRFKVTDNEGNVIGIKSVYEVQQGEISFGIKSNVNFMVRRSEDTQFEIKDMTATSFTIDASDSPAKNGEDYKGTIVVDLYDKAGKSRLKKDYYSFELLQKAFLFRWTDTPVADQEAVREFSVDFNDLDPQPFKFESSGKWQVQGKPDWLDVENQYGKALSNGEAGKYTLYLSANEMNNDNEKAREGMLRIVTENYPNDPLVIALTQNKAPKIKLSKYSVNLKENDSFYLDAYADVDKYTVKWTVTEGNDIVSLSSTSGQSIKVTALTEGQAKIVATITVDGHSMTTAPCEVSVYREYNGGNTGEEIGDDEGEW
jgi:hypothetical protein